jgi:single-strand selective monofunctional uracil DNA glycosylase
MLRLGSPKGRAKALQDAAKALAGAVGGLRFGPPVSHVYNPLDYAWAMHAAYIEAYAEPRKRVVFLGMNPGPFGMAQTGVPFGDVVTVRDWMHLSAPIGAPAQQHPKRPVLGLATPRREISGARLWGAVAAHWRTPAAFFREHYIANYCPLLFLEASGRNLTPDKLSVGEKARLFPACDEHPTRPSSAPWSPPGSSPSAPSPSTRPAPPSPAAASGSAGSSTPAPPTPRPTATGPAPSARSSPP